jgi:hypothetical protein
VEFADAKVLKPMFDVAFGNPRHWVPDAKIMCASNVDQVLSVGDQSLAEDFG